jgi:inner membrane protein
MDNITHSLAGLALSQIGFNRKTRYATAALIVSSNIPDIDVAWSGGGNGINYLAHHRGITHSIVGVAALAVLTAALFAYLASNRPARKPTPRLNWRWLLIACVLGTACHVLLDFTNAYGVRPFLPFSGHWYAWDIMFIVDPLLLAVLVASLSLPAVLRLVSEEIGAKRLPARWGAWLALLSMVAIWTVHDFAHRRVLTQLDSHVYGQENPVRVGAFPTGANPFEWTGVVETGSALFVFRADPRSDSVDLDHANVFPQPDLDSRSAAALATAMKTRTGRVFADFARFLWPQITGTGNGFAVMLRDLRFPGWGASVVLDDELHVISQRFTFQAGLLRRSAHLRRTPSDAALAAALKR